MEYILSGAEAERYTTDGANSARTIVIVLETTQAAAARGRLKCACATVRRQIDSIAKDDNAIPTRVALVTYDGAVRVWATRLGAKPVALALPAAHGMPTLPAAAAASTWHNLTDAVGALGELLGVIGEEIAEPVTAAGAPPAAFASAVHVALRLIGADGDGDGGGAGFGGGEGGAGGGSGGAAKHASIHPPNGAPCSAQRAMQPEVISRSLIDASSEKS